MRSAHDALSLQDGVGVGGPVPVPACSNTCYLQATRSFQLPSACQVSPHVLRLVALRNNKVHTRRRWAGTWQQRKGGCKGSLQSVRKSKLLGISASQFDMI